MQADLVVDASGSSSKTAEWLEQLGHTLPPTMTIDAGLRYTARMYEMPDDPDRGWITAICGSHPDYTRTAMVIPIETNKWQASLTCITYLYYLSALLICITNLYFLSVLLVCAS